MKKLSGIWKDWKEEYVQCSNVIDGMQCETWSMIRVKENVNVDGMNYMCGFCAYNELEVMKNKVKKSVETEKTLKKEIETKVEALKTNVADVERSWTEVVSKNAKKEKVTITENALNLLKLDMKKEVKAVSEEEKRKCSFVIFGMDEKNGVSNKAQAEEVLSKLDIEREYVIKDVIRMKKKDDISKNKPLLVEVRNEIEKWAILKKKSMLRNVDGYERVFLELDLTPEQRKEKLRLYTERKKREAQPAEKNTDAEQNTENNRAA